jgi:hypothetical protein
MEAPGDVAGLVPCAEYTGEDAEDDALVGEMIERAHSYLSAFDWCGQIVGCYIGDIAVGGVVAVLLFEIIPSRDDVDAWLWVVIGDLPPAYLVTDEAPKPAEALRKYIAEMQLWIAAVRAGESVDQLIPVSTTGGGSLLEPTETNAENLDRRLRFLEQKILG